MESNLDGKRVVLGITGSIAAYKAANIASSLTKLGAQVDVILTEAATRFVAPLTFQALTGRPVYTSLWEPGSGEGLGAHIAHVGLGNSADLLLIAPATSNTIAKIAHGLADNLLSVTALAARCPILIAPAMDAGMYETPITQANVATLRERGVHFAGPARGRMASGLEGLGRFLEPDEIVGHARYVLGLTGPLAGRKIVVSAGPTREPLDPVRFVSNRSSGKQGFAIAQAALDAGAQVTLICGPASLQTPIGAERIDVTTAQEMEQAVLAHSATADVLVMAAAVGDFRPETIAPQKIKKSDDPGLTLSLIRNPDILANLSEEAQRPRLTVGFAAESQDLVANAQDKLIRKKLDLIIANDIAAPDAGFAVDTNRVVFITGDGIEKLPLISKEAVAARLMVWIIDRMSN